MRRPTRAIVALCGVLCAAVLSACPVEDGAQESDTTTEEENKANDPGQ